MQRTQFHFTQLYQSDGRSVEYPTICKSYQTNMLDRNLFRIEQQLPEPKSSRMHGTMLGHLQLNELLIATGTSCRMRGLEAHLPAGWEKKEEDPQTAR